MSNLARKASDLIRQASGRWLNLDPRIPIEVGAYGDIDSETGRFIAMGNIYDDDGVLRVVPDVKQYPPLQGLVAKEEKLKTEEASSWSFDFDPEVSVAGVLDGTVQLHFDVSNGKRAAYLITKESRTDYMPTDKLLRKLSKVKELANMYLVIERTICYGYSFGITSVGKSSVSAKVKADAPIAVGGPVTAGGQAAFGHTASSTVAWSVQGEQKDYKYVATLTMRLMNPDWKRRLMGSLGQRGAIPEVPEDERWVDAPPPWAPLTVDGEEELPEDEVI